VIQKSEVGRRGGTRIAALWSNQGRLTSLIRSVAKVQRLHDVDVQSLERIRHLRVKGRARWLTKDLAFMARYKYDSYEVYNPVKRFLPSLLEWITQFRSPSEKETALYIVRNLLFLSRREILELSHVVYQKILNDMLGEIVKAQRLRPFDYSVAYRHLPEFIRTQCVFVGMSDGAQIDYFRRQSNGMIGNDQVVPYYKIDKDEIGKLSRARYAFLIDDVCLSATTFLGEKKEGAKEHRFEGQLGRFLSKWKEVEFRRICYCPYVVTEQALKRLRGTVLSDEGSQGLYCSSVIPVNLWYADS